MKQPNKIPANPQILLIPLNWLLLPLLVVLTTGNMDGATSPLLHLFSFASQNPLIAAATHSNCCCTTESRSFRPQRRTILNRQHTPIFSLSFSLARSPARSRVLRSISRAYGRDVRRCTRTYENVDVEDTMYKIRTLDDKCTYLCTYDVLSR
jgi:hypothetical protein